MSSIIHFTKPFISGKELDYIARAIGYGDLAGDGYFTEQCSSILEEHFRIHKVLMTTSCTAALDLAAMLCELSPEDEVILPSFTFVSTANAIARLGAKPVFVDIRPDTLNMDECLIEQAITSKTKAIIPVHYAGVGCEMDRIAEIAKRHELRVIEDAAQGVNAFYSGRALGSIGHLGTYSFHQTKNYVCGQGGALCINSSELVDRAEIIRDKGTNRKKFLRGEIDKYSWVEVGSACVPSEVICAFLYAQLELLDVVTERRREVYEFYMQTLGSLASEGLLQLPVIPEKCESNYHIFHILLQDMETRDALIENLRENDIMGVFHYIPLHTSPMGRKLGCHKLRLPVTEDLSGRLLRLPVYHELTKEDQLRVVGCIIECLTRREQSTVYLSQGLARAVR